MGFDKILLVMLGILALIEVAFVIEKLMILAWSWWWILFSPAVFFALAVLLMIVVAAAFTQ